MGLLRLKLRRRDDPGKRASQAGMKGSSAVSLLY
jgi:hypothetical protein